jgi:hypothetical protein
MTGVLLTTLAVLLARGYSNTLEIEVTHTELELADLPAAFEGYRIALISCLHTDRYARRERLLRKILQQLDADLLVVAGDFRRAGGSTDGALESCSQIFEGLRFPDGIVAGMGNHDRHRMLEPLRRLGVQILLNDCVTVIRPVPSGPERPGEPNSGKPPQTPLAPKEASLTVIVGGPGRRRDPDWDRALRRAPPDAFLVGVCHSPDGVVSAAKHSIPLVLCGHTHGGQILLPGFGPLITETKLVDRRLASGLGRFQNTLLYVNRGIGWTGLPLRFNCPPEVSILTLRCPVQGSRPAPSQQPPETE